MLAETIHSVADTGNQGLLFLGGRRSRRAPTSEHPFGFGTERYFYAFVVALVLFSLGSLFAIVEGIEKLIHPEHLENPIWAFGVLGIGLLLGVIAIVLAIEMKSLMIGEAVAPEVEQQVQDAMLDGPEVRRIIHVRTQHLGPDDVPIAAKLELRCDTMSELARSIDTVEARVRDAVPSARLIFIEPDVYRADGPEPSQEVSP